MSDAVLVTGAFGLVGTATVKHLAALGRHVVATDVDTPPTRKAAANLPPGVGVRWADLTDPAAVEGLLADVSPAAIIHLAAVIPPLCYAKPRLARRVNVDATANVVKAAEAQPKPPRLVLASSIAVHGPRNPHRISDVLTADTPVNPFDNYGKVEAEAIVRASGLDWVILRLGGVLTVDVRDVAHAFAGATTADAVGRTLLIGGDDSHRLIQGDIGSSTAAAMGLVGALPRGRKGDPDDDAWFATDWMDTATAQQVLKHQHHTWPDMLAETANKVGWKRYVLRLVAPLAREYLKRQSPYYRSPGRYANPWEAVRSKWGAPEADGRTA